MSRWHLKAAVAFLVAASTGTGLAGIAPAATTNARQSIAAAAVPPIETAPGVRERMGFYDARHPTTSTELTLAQSVLADRSAAALPQLRRLAGSEPIISIDTATGTPDNLTSLDGYLTGRSNRSAVDVVLAYVRQHLDTLGLTPADLDTLRLRRSYRDPAGIRHLSWLQSVDGIPVFGNGLRAHVTGDGRLIALQGAPVGNLADLVDAAATTPELGAAQARDAAAEDVGGDLDSDAIQRQTRTGGGVTWTNGDYADPVWFVTADGAHRAWSSYVRAGDGLAYTHVIDAETGEVLYRNDLVDFDHGDARVYDYYPGADRGGSPRTVNFFRRGWLKDGASWLAGPNVSAFADLNDDNAVDDRETTPVPGNRHQAQFVLTGLRSNPLCSPRFVCTWNPDVAYSWRRNQNADVTNAFYLANNFHDWLARRPIGFTAQAGNFERSGGDPVLLNALDGADTGNGFPDGDHIDNANMSTPPDGSPPMMQMYLWHYPKSPNALDPYLPTSGAFDASVVYHEYAHGLSNRLVVDATGNSTLDSIQAGAMGEAWSDYYAMDYLVTTGLQADSVPRDGQIRAGRYVVADQSPLRTMAMDCDPESAVHDCTRIDGTKGGYTYGDFPTVGASPEVHSSGEVWAQTLWDIRERYGHRIADMLITRGMELSPADPSMLDMRNAILQADRVVYGSTHTPGLWRLFAHRGMGWFAGAVGGGDVRPAADFHVRPPTGARRGSLTGSVVDAGSGAAIPGALVTVTGHDSGYVGAYSARTDASGSYTIANLPPGPYKKVVTVADGHEILTRAVTVPIDGVAAVDWWPRRDWAAASGGGSVTGSDAPDYAAYGCGPDGAIDLSRTTGWGSDTAGNDGAPYPDPKSITVQLARPVDITQGDAAFAVDPTATCGDPGSSSTGEYAIEVSTDGDSWQTAVDGTGAAALAATDRYRLTDVESEITRSDIAYVRFTIVSPQVPDFERNCPGGPYGGCTFMDLTELQVFGAASAQ